MKLTLYEQETICLFNEAEALAEIDTFYAPLQRQLSALCESHPDQIELIRKDSSGCMSFRFPKKWLRVVPPRILTPAQRAVLDKINEARGRGVTSTPK